MCVIKENFIIFRKWCWMRIHNSVINVFQQSIFNVWKGMKFSCKILGIGNRSYFIILTFIKWVFSLPIMCICLIIIDLKRQNTNFNCTTAPVVHVYYKSISEFYSWKYLFSNLGDCFFQSGCRIDKAFTIQLQWDSYRGDL